MHVQEDIKKKLPPGTHTVSDEVVSMYTIHYCSCCYLILSHFISSIFIKAPVVSKKASELWRNLPAEERSHWNKEAAKEKKRYIAEKELYTGPVSRILF